jgi:hypothetical protein
MSWKESLNIDGHQFYKYIQNEQSPLILKGLTEHIKDHDIDIGKLGPGLEQAQKGVGVKPGNGIPTLFSCI